MIDFSIVLLSSTSLFYLILFLFLFLLFYFTFDHQIFNQQWLVLSLIIWRQYGDISSILHFLFVFVLSRLKPYETTLYTRVEQKHIYRGKEYIKQHNVIPMGAHNLPTYIEYLCFCCRKHHILSKHAGKY